MALNLIPALGFNRHINTIHCDMDGVLVDFDKYIEDNLSGDACGNDAIMWAELEKDKHFYRKMSPTPYAARLWSAIQAVGCARQLLTAIPRVTSIPGAEDDKRAWCADNRHVVFDGENPKLVIGPFSRDKHKHCRPYDILIDDRLDNCKQWAAAGGYAIFHNGDIEETLADLQAIVSGEAK